MKIRCDRLAPHLPGLLIAAFFLAIYILIGLPLVRDSHLYLGGVFSMDSDRAAWDLTDPGGNHYRTAVHPLFVLLCQPIARAFIWLIGSKPLGLLLLQSLLGAGCVWMVFYAVMEFCHERKAAMVLTALYGFSSTQLLYSTMTETYNYTSFSLLVVYHVLRWGTRAASLDNRLLTVLGVLVLAFLTTNLAPFAILLWFGMLSEKEPHPITRIFGIVSSAIVIAILLAIVQKWLYPSSILFFVYSPTNEGSYMTFSPSLKDVHDYFINAFVHSWLLTPFAPHLRELVDYLPFTGSLALIFAIAFYALMIVLCLGAARCARSWRTPTLFSCLAFNLLLHLVYNPWEAYLYAGDFIFLMIFLMALGYGCLLSRAKKPVFALFVVFLIGEWLYNAAALTDFIPLMMTVK